MPERYVVYEAKRARDPRFAFRAVQPDGKAFHAIRLDDDEADPPGGTVVHDRDEAIQAVLRRASDGGR